MIDDESPQKAADVVCRFTLCAEACALLHQKESAREFYQALHDKGFYKDAVRLLAYLLPKREAVWWGSLCVWQVGRPRPPKETDAALQAAVTWVLDPSEPHRQAAQKAGDLAKGTPAGQLALAAAWSGGSMTPPELPAAPPPPFLTNQLVAAVILDAANRGAPAKRSLRYLQFLQWGHDVADGKNLWK